LRILFYGRLADVIGREVQVDAAAGCSIAQLRRRLTADHPNADRTLQDGRIRACVDDAVVDDDYIVTATDKVEFLPPVSGG
jgi:molybdopterin converting factor small subunit